MALKITTKTTKKNTEYIYENSKNVPELTPRSLNQLNKLSKIDLICVVKDDEKIVGWVISEPLSNSTFELGLAFVEKPYRGQNLLYKMLAILTKDKESNYVFATFEPKILNSMCELLGFYETTLSDVVMVSRGKFVSKRISSIKASRKVAAHLKEKKALYGIRRAAKQ